MADVGGDLVSMASKKPIEGDGVFSKSIVGCVNIGINERIAKGHFKWFGNCGDEVMWEVAGLRITSHEVGLRRDDWGRSRLIRPLLPDH